MVTRPDGRPMGRGPAGGEGRTAAISAVVAPPGVPGLGLGQRQPQPARAARRLLGLVPVALSAPEVVPVVVVVVTQAEEPHQPHDKGPDVEDAEANHEDPPLQAHCNASVSQVGGVCNSVR